MNLRNIGIVYRKELVDLLRDRRTIISMIVVPVLVVPALMIGFGTSAAKLMGRAQKEVSPVMLLGGEDSPKTATALRALPAFKFVPASADYTNQISEKKIRAAIELPPGFDEAVRTGKTVVVRICTYEGELKSMIAARSLEGFFRARHEAVIQERLAARKVPAEVIKPFEIRQANVAPPKKVSGNLIGVIFPYLVIIMCLTGTIYPAVDLTAGEKERGTMETLLCSPVARTHLVLGKCLVVFTVSMATAFLALASNGISFLVIKQLVGKAAGPMSLPLALDSFSLVSVFVMMVPLAIFFAATTLAIGLFARSAKEANTYLQPLLFLAIIPTAGAMLPGIELNLAFALVPVFNVSLVSKEIISGTFHWHYIALVFGSMCAYAAIAVGVAVALFKRESVLFRT